MKTNSQLPLISLVAGAIVVLAIAVATVALLTIDSSGEGGSRLPESFDYDLSAYHTVDPALIGYEQTAEIPLAMAKQPGSAVLRRLQSQTPILNLLLDNALFSVVFVTIRIFLLRF